jgi:tetratricopeptide (TPR) repeat protein
MRLGVWSFRAFHYQGGNPEHMDSAIDALNVSLNAIPDDDRSDRRQAHIWLRQAYCYGSRFDKTHELYDLDDTIKAAKKALEISPKVPEIIIQTAPLLVESLMSRYETQNEISDLNNAINLGKRLLDALPTNNSQWFGNMVSVAHLLVLRLEWSEDSEIWEELSRIITHAMANVDPNGLGISELLEDFARWLKGLVDNGKSIKYLDEAIRILNFAHLANLDQPECQLRILGQIGDIYHQRFEKIGHIADLQVAVEASNQILSSLAGPDSSTAKTDARLVLVNRLKAMVDQQIIQFKTAAITTIDNMIEQFHLLLGQPSRDAQLRCHQFHELSVALSIRFFRTNEEGDLDSAIDVGRKALALQPQGVDHVIHADRLSHFANLLIQRNKLARTNGKKTVGDVGEAVVSCQQALELMDANVSIAGLPVAEIIAASNPDYMSPQENCRALYENSDAPIKMRLLQYGGIWKQLALCYAERFQSASRRDQEALDSHIKYLHMGHTGDPEAWPIAYFELGAAFRYRSRLANTQVSKQQSLEQAVQFLRASAEAEKASRTDRWHSLELLALIFSEQQKWGEALTTYQTSLSVIPQLSRTFLSSADQYSAMHGSSGWSRRACSTALNANADIAYALEILETGRGTIADMYLETMADIATLAPDQASAFSEAQDGLRLLRQRRNNESPHTEDSSKHALTNQDAELHYRQVVKAIRADPKTADFLLPSSIPRTLEALGGDTIIVVNYSPLRCDAFMINQKHNRRQRRLHGMTGDAVMNWCSQLASTRPSVSLSLLAWLWSELAQPVLEELGLLESPRPRELPRLIWILVGDLAQLPLHAAGLYEQENSTGLMDYAVSSYASSVRAFVLERRRPHISQSFQKEKALLVSMGKATCRPGLVELPNARKEVETIVTLCPSLGLDPITLHQPTRHAVLSELARSAVIHFAGHGIADASDPTRSGLILDDGPLTVADLLDHEPREKTPPRLLAFLSACLTGTNNVSSLADESVHLIHAFQLVGFRHVIGSLWPVSDSICAKVTPVVYQHIAKEKKTTALTDDMIARSLHCVLFALRDEWVKERGAIWNRAQHGALRDPPEAEFKLEHLAMVDLGKSDGDESGTADAANLAHSYHRAPNLRIRRQTANIITRADWIPFVHHGP